MKIFFEDPLVFETLDGRRDLHRVFLRAGVRQHTLVIPDRDRFLRSAFFLSVAEMDRVEWEELVWRTGYDEDERADEPGARPISFHASVGRHKGPRTDAGRFTLTVAEIGDWAEQPLRLLMENERDWTLLEAAARAFGRTRIEEAYVNRWLVPDGRGGCGEVLNSLRRREAEERLFAFVDQDPDPATRRRSATSRQIEIECLRAPCVPHHITWKHEIENYVPRSILEARIFSGKKLSTRRSRAPRPKSPHARFVEWLKLSDAERDMGDMKAMFGKAFMEKAVSDLRDATKWSAADLLERAGKHELLGVLILIEAFL